HDHDFLKTAEATVAPGGTSAMSELSSAFDGFYSLRERSDGTSTWWMWKDGVTTSHYGTTTDLSTAPASLTARSNRLTTFGYENSAVMPPALTTAAFRLNSSPHLYMSTKKTSYNHRVAYVSYALYQRVPWPGSYAPDEADHGVLQYSVDDKRT